MITWMPEAGTTKLDWQWLIEIDWADILLIIVTIKKFSENTEFIHFIMLTDENPIKNWELNCLETETEKESSQPVTTLSFSMQQEIKLNGDVEKKHLN